MPEYIIRWDGWCGTMDERISSPSPESAIRNAAVMSFTKKKFERYSIIPEGFTVYTANPVRKIAEYSRREGNQDMITVFGGRNIPIPYGTSFRIAVSYRGDRGWLKRPVLSKEVYHTIKDARAGAHKLIRQVMSKDKIYDVGVQIYSNMFSGKNTDVGAVCYFSDYGGFMWNPVDCGEAYYVPGVSANGNLTRTIYRTT